jgi:hypothetical protein
MDAAPPPERVHRTPPYYRDSRFDQEIETRAGIVAPEQLEKVLNEVSGTSVAVPGFASGFSLTLPEKHRKLKDALDQLAALAQGEWKKVGDAYVLVLPPAQLEAAEMTPRVRELAARRALKALAAALTPRQQEALRQGRALSIGLAALAQRRYFVELGMLGYYELPLRRDPRLIRGEGVSLSLAAGEGSGELQVSLLNRTGRSVLWLKEALGEPPQPAPGP